MGLSVTGLVKSYGAKPVLTGVDLTVLDGEIHALLGPNGSGKSTLIRCLSGAVRPDAGSISLDGVDHLEFTPREAINAGISVIYQQFSLVPTLTVAENIFLGAELRAGMRIDRATQEREAKQLLDQFSRPIRADMPVHLLSVGDRQIVEIAKAMRRSAKLLVLDEPTAALDEREAEQLGQHLRRLRDDGLAILYVTHLIGEVFAIADRVTVLRDGGVVLADQTSRVNPTQIISAISPASSETDADAVRRSDPAAGPSVLDLEGLVVDGVGPVTFSVHAGEVVGIFGLLGSGRTEILEGTYAARTPSAGVVRVGGVPLRSATPASALRAGIVLVAGDRIRQSIFDRLSTQDNMLLPHLRAMGRGYARRPAMERRVFGDVARSVRLKPDDPDLRAWTLSGGNQQKLAVARWLVGLEKVQVLLLDEPTQGIDIGARRDLYGLIRRLARQEGKAVLFTSSDPEETLSLADRVLVLRRGRIVDELVRGTFSEEQILALAHGAALQDPGPAPTPEVLVH